MALSFNLYYFSQETGEKMQQAIAAIPQGLVAHSFLMSKALPDPTASAADVYFIEYQEQVPKLNQWIETIQHHNGQGAIFLYIRQADTDTLLKALRLGIQECFVSTISQEDFQKAVKRLQDTKISLQPGEKTQVIALLGCKGGAGVTFVAANLAHALADHARESALLIDLDLRAANVNSFLDIEPRYTILDVIENFDRLDPQYLQDIIHHNESGLDVLPGPTRLEDSELVQAHHVDKILAYIRSQNLYRWILLDLGDVLDEITLKALELSDLVLLITVLTIPGLKDAKKTLEMFQLLEFPQDKIQLVVNSYRKECDIKEAEAKKFLCQEFFSILRYDHDSVVRSINEGQPLVKTQPRHRLSLDFLALAKKIAPDKEDSGQRSWGLFGIKRLLQMRK
jgi:pilus assembly protein CpaE